MDMLLIIEKSGVVMKAFRKRQSRAKRNLGSTITEILIVVMVMASALCFLIPSARKALVKGRETADIANIRAAHIRFEYLYMTEEDLILPNSKTDAGELVKQLLQEDGELKLHYIATKKQKYGISCYFVPETKTYYITYTPRYFNGGEPLEWAFEGDDVQFLNTAP